MNNYKIVNENIDPYYRFKTNNNIAIEAFN